DRHRPLGGKRKPVERSQGREERWHVATPMAQEVIDDLGGKVKATLPSVRRQCLRLLLVGKRQRLVDKAPAQARAQILAERQCRERRSARGNDSPAALLE